MYRIEGDGSYQHTLIFRDGEQIPYEHCEFRVNVDECVANVDGVEGNIEHIIITGVYTIISKGEFISTNLLSSGVMLRGVQSLLVKIEKDYHPIICIDAILLPNIVEVKDEE